MTDASCLGDPFVGGLSSSGSTGEAASSSPCSSPPSVTSLLTPDKVAAISSGSAIF